MDGIVFTATHVLLLVMNPFLAYPIYLMVVGQRDYTFGLIPAIGLAAYTTFRIALSVMHFRRSRKMANVLVREIKTVNLIDSLVALLTLSHALIMTHGQEPEIMLWSGALILMMTTGVTIYSLARRG